MNVENVNSLINLVNFEYERQDKFCELQIKISVLAAAVFAIMGLVFHHFKSIDSMRLSFYMFGASLAAAVITSGVYFYNIRNNADAYKAAVEPVKEMIEAQKDMLEAQKDFLTAKKEMLNAKTNWYEKHAELFVKQTREKEFDIKDKETEHEEKARIAEDKKMEAWIAKKEKIEKKEATEKKDI